MQERKGCNEQSATTIVEEEMRELNCEGELICTVFDDILKV